ncbi:MAG: hypothetical protein WCG78_08510, partial [Candidatus Omnitrophota bacterium]
MKVSLMKLMRVVAAITLLCSGSLAYLVPAGSCEPSVLRPRAFLDRQAENTPFKVANQLLLDIIGKKAGAEAAQQLTEIALRDLTRGERLHILGLARFAQKDNKPIVALQVVERYLGALDRLDTDFDVTAANMPQIENAFIQHQNARLNNGPSSLLMIPIPVRLPTGQEVGTIYVPDIGGTKLAVAEVILDGAKGVTVKVTSERIPDECKKEAAGGALFDFVARNIAVFIGSLRREGAKVVSMVVSFGAKQKAIDDGEVLEVGKWPQLTGILGKNPVALLNDAFARAGLPEEIRVAGFSGDLICALYAGRYIDSGCDAAFNIGTGINGAIFVPAGEVHNWGDVQPVAGEELVPINIEMCGFADKSVRRNAYDKVLDDQSGTRGIDLFEKMTAGLYLGELARITFAALVERKVLFNGTSSEAFSTRGGLLIEDGMSAIETDTS